MPAPVPGDNWTYSGDPTTSQRDEVRFLAEDIDEEMPWLTDGEIDYLISKWYPLSESTTLVAAAVAGVISRKLAGLGTVNADGVSVDLSDLSARYRQVAEDLRSDDARINEAGAPQEASAAIDSLLDFDPSIRPLNFSIGMHDNPEAGWQTARGFGGLDWVSDWVH